MSKADVCTDSIPPRRPGRAAAAAAVPLTAASENALGVHLDRKAATALAAWTEALREHVGSCR